MVEAWVVVAVIGLASTILGMMQSRITTQNEVIRTQKETIATQARSLDMLEVAGKLQDKLYRTLPPPPGGPNQ